MATIAFAAATSHTPMLLATDETLPRFVETDQKMKHRRKRGAPWSTYGICWRRPIRSWPARLHNGISSPAKRRPAPPPASCARP